MTGGFHSLKSEERKRGIELRGEKDYIYLTQSINLNLIKCKFGRHHTGSNKRWS